MRATRWSHTCRGAAGPGASVPPLSASACLHIHVLACVVVSAARIVRLRDTLVSLDNWATVRASLRGGVVKLWLGCVSAGPRVPG